jgi:hypothetical protein
VSLLQRIQRLASALTSEPAEAPKPCPRCDDLRRELDRQLKIKADYWDVIERLEAQRDQWQRMYNESCSRHLGAQTLLEAALVQARDRLGKAIAWLNEYREKAGEHSPLVPPPEHLDPRGAPLGEADRYVAFLQSLDARAPHPLDGKAERAAVAAKHGDTPPVPKQP